MINIRQKKQHTRKSKCTQDILDFIKRYVCKYKIINAVHIRSIIENTFDVSISRSYFYIILNTLELTYKKIYIKKQPFLDVDYESMKIIFYEQINAIKKDNIISIDETAIYLNCKNNYGWAQKGCKCIIKEKDKNIFQKKYSLLMAISNKEVMLYIIYEKSINGEKYINFIKELIEKYGKKYTLLMDNSSIHKTKKFRDYTESEKLNILYNIPYNPETNPIEMLFCPIKKNIKNHNTKTIINIEKSIDAYIENISGTVLTKMFDKALSMQI
jgi:transposase